MGIRDIFSRGSKKESGYEESSHSVEKDGELVELKTEAEEIMINDARDGDSISNNGEEGDSDEQQELDTQKPQEDDVEEPEETPPPRNLPPFKNPHELLSMTIPARAAIADMRLRSNLTGTTEVVLNENSERYVYDWSSEPLKFRQESGPKSGSVDCSIHLNGSALMRIASGDLNPQVAMLSDKIRVEGKAGFAIYFFNLVASRGR